MNWVQLFVCCLFVFKTVLSRLASNSPCIWRWPRMSVLLLLSAEFLDVCRVSRHMLSHPLYVVLWILPKESCLLGKHTSNWATTIAPGNSCLGRLCACWTASSPNPYCHMLWQGQKRFHYPHSPTPTPALNQKQIFQIFCLVKTLLEKGRSQWCAIVLWSWWRSWAEGLWHDHTASLNKGGF